MTASDDPVITEEELKLQAVDPSWFESPAQSLSVSGGTAAFYLLKMTPEGLQHVSARQAPSAKNRLVDTNYWIGKDLSHAADEKDFYYQVLQIRNQYGEMEGDETSNRDLTQGIGLLEEFMFDYLGILQTETSDGGTANLLVMRNMRNNFEAFRMLDLKIGEKTAQAGWKGKSRLRAMKHHLMDGLSNSSSEGYRLAGFNGCPEVFDSMEPLLDILSTATLSESQHAGTESARSTASTSSTATTSGWKTMWGNTIDDSTHAQAKRFMLNALDGTGVFSFFFDLHMDGLEEKSDSELYYSPVEVAEIVAHEFMVQLMRLAAACHQVKIPQKWIGSSVAVAYDAGQFPDRSSAQAESSIRSKVLCKIFDWGRSELLTCAEFDQMTPEAQHDREKYWELYKYGIDRLSYNATRFYYHQFTKETLYSDITIQVYDFDSMSNDDYIGKVTIPLPDPKNTAAVEKLNETTTYKLKGLLGVNVGTIELKIAWKDLPESSRLAGCWKVLIERAHNLPGLDPALRTSDPYCRVMGNVTAEDGPHFIQRTCIITRTCNPEWMETIDVPVCRQNELEPSLQRHGMAAIADKYQLSDHLKWDKTWSFHRASKEDMTWWIKALKGGEA